MTADPTQPLFNDASCYEDSINWAARLAREIPVLTEVFGPPRPGGILDAGCGPGRQACALAALGYAVTGVDHNREMLGLAVSGAAQQGLSARFLHAPYADLLQATGGGFDGLACIGNSLAAAGSASQARSALRQFAACLRPGGRLFVQVLNFEAMRSEAPCVRGPRVATAGGRTFISTRVFHFGTNEVTVTNLTLWQDGAWQCRSHSGVLYPLSKDELVRWSTTAGLVIDHLWGSYDRDAFDVTTHTDLIAVATRR